MSQVNPNIFRELRAYSGSVNNTLGLTSGSRGKENDGGVVEGEGLELERGIGAIRPLPEFEKVLKVSAANDPRKRC